MPSLRVQHREFEPPTELREAVKCFWHDLREGGETSQDFEVLPDGYAEITFHFGRISRITDEGTVQPLPSPLLVGLLNHPLRFSTQGRIDVLGIRCFPWAVFDLLGLPPGQPDVSLLAHPLASLQAPLARWMESGQVEAAVSELKRYCLQASPQSALDDMLFKAGDALRESRGTLPVRQVAARAHATVRTLERKFKQSSGHTVKDVSGLMRFEQVRNRLWHHPRSNLAALAQEVGYTDQAHLSREFKRYTGMTPAAFARAKQREHAERDG